MCIQQTSRHYQPPLMFGMDLGVAAVVIAIPSLAALHVRLTEVNLRSSNNPGDQLGSAPSSSNKHGKMLANSP